MRDLTSRRAAELELRDSRERYRSILQNLRGIAYRVTAGEFQPLFLGGSVFEITGRRSEEMTAPRFQPAAAAAAAGGELEEIVQNVERMLGRIIGEDIELETICAQNLAPISFDPGQVEQIIVNLAVNARDAMASGGRL
ncbi:MAG: hypothetical protein ACRD21_15605, partial [Vicinamibacteria bacterium]